MPRKAQAKIRRCEPMDMGSGKSHILNDDLFATVHAAIRDALSVDRAVVEQMSANQIDKEAAKRAGAIVNDLKQRGRSDV